MNTECIVPDWLHDIFLGYDDPGAAHYSRSNIISRIIASPMLHHSPAISTYLVTRNSNYFVNFAECQTRSEI